MGRGGGLFWQRAAAHCDGKRLENGADVSILEQQIPFLEKCEHHGTYGALRTAAEGACWSNGRVAELW